MRSTTELPGALRPMSSCVHDQGVAVPPSKHDVINEVARRLAESNGNVTHRALSRRFADAIPPEEFDQLLDSMVPEFLSVREAPDPVYDLTAAAWLESAFRARIDLLVDAFLRSYREAGTRAPEAPPQIKGPELLANGGSQNDGPLAFAIGRALYLYDSGAYSKELEKVWFGAPVDLDALLPIAGVPEFYEYRLAHPKERAEFLARRRLPREVRQIRDAVWLAFTRSGQWPEMRDLDVEFSSKGILVERVVESDIFIRGSVVCLSVRGLWMTPNAQVEQDRVFKVLRALCDAYVRGPAKTFLRAYELHELNAEISEGDAAWCWRFLEHNNQFHVGTNAGALAFNLVPDLVAFRGARSLDDALFNLSRRARPRTTRRPRFPLVPGLPWPASIEDDELDSGVELPLAPEPRPLSQVVVVALAPGGALKIAAVSMPPVRQDRDVNRGAQMGAWLVGDRIGEGGYGKVYLAEHALAGFPVVLKAIELRSDEERERFRREANALGSLQHPGVPVVYDAGIYEDDLGYIVLERLHGADLQRLLNNAWRPSEADVIAIVTRSLQILGVAHDHGIIHRDIKPSNLFLQVVDEVQSLRVLDFGCAKLVGATKLTKTGDVIGTLIYQPPEALSLGRFDAAGDIWSLGVTAYELATGVHPYSGGTRADVIARILSAKVAPFDIVRFPRLGGFVVKSLLANPDDRPQTAAEALALLR